MHARSALVSLALAAALPVARGGDAVLQVRTVVVARVDAQTRSAPATVLVQPADVERGYVDVPGPVVIRVRSNLARAFALEFRSADGAVTRVVPRSASLPVAQSSESTLLLPAAVRDEAIAVHLRLFLAPQAVPGTYPWPVRLGTTA